MNRSTELLDIDISLSDEEMASIFGVACEDYEPDCIVCKAWRQHQNTGIVTINVEREYILKYLLE